MDGGWQVRQPFDGIYIWRDPYGHYYLVDHTGTRKTTSPTQRAAPAGEDGRRTIVIELYRTTTTLDLTDYEPAA